MLSHPFRKNYSNLDSGDSGSDVAAVLKLIWSVNWHIMLSCSVLDDGDMVHANFVVTDFMG